MPDIPNSGQAGDQEGGGNECDGSHPENTAEEHSAGSKCRTSTEVSSPGLENLPPELRSYLLSWMPDLETLRSLVRASRLLHAQYRYDRDKILYLCLDRELNGLADAYATAMSRVCELGSSRTDEKITGFLDVYRGWLSWPETRLHLNALDPGPIRWLAAYHLSVARPLARLYSKWALENLKKTTPSSDVHVVARSVQDISLSRSEEIRIFRALYRYATYYHLFGRNRGKRHGEFRHHEINEIFFCLFDPWEVEAVGCIELFVRLRYEDIFNEVRVELHPENVRFRQENGVYNPEGSFDLEREHDDFMDGTVSRGLKITARLLSIDNHEELVSRMQRCLTHNQELDAPMRKALGSVAQSDRREMTGDFPDDRDVAEREQDPLVFHGDAVPPDGPPLAWVITWHEKYVNIYGEYVPESLRRCGYIMWDARRWTDMRAEKMIARQWETTQEELLEEIEVEYGWAPLGR